VRGSIDNSDKIGIRYDPESARDTIDRLGLSGSSISLVTANFDNYNAMAEIVADELQNNSDIP
jgi:hypothetical protein